MDAPAVGTPSRLAEIAKQVRGQVEGQHKVDNTAPAVPAPVPAAPVTPPAPEATPRGEDGKFTTDPHKAAMREVIKRQQAELKALREAKPTPQAPAASAPASEESALVASMTPETRAWYEKAGKPLMERAAKAVLSPHEKALAKLQERIQQEDDDARFQAEYNDWSTGMLAEGTIVDNRKMLAALQEFDTKGYRLGSTDAEHFANVYAFLSKQNTGAGTPVVSGNAAIEAAKKEAADKAAAGGVRPGSTPTPNPEAERKAEIEGLRKAGWTDDQNAKAAYWNRRLKGLGVLPSERGRTPDGE